MQKKEWFNVYAPKIFNEKLVAEIPASEDKALIGRNVNIRLDEITGNPHHSYVYLKFKIKEVNGKNAYTELVGMEIPRVYLSSFVRKRKSIIEETINLNFDGKKVVVKYNVYFNVKTSSTAESDCRKVIKQQLEKMTKIGIENFIKKIISNEVQKELMNVTKKIVPVRKIEIRKIEL